MAMDHPSPNFTNQKNSKITNQTLPWDFLRYRPPGPTENWDVYCIFNKKINLLIETVSQGIRDGSNQPSWVETLKLLFLRFFSQFSEKDCFEITVSWIWCNCEVIAVRKFTQKSKKFAWRRWSKWYEKTVEKNDSMD